MTTFSAIDIGRTGIGFAHQWLDTIAHNLANSNTITSPDEEPFRASHPVAQTLTAPFSHQGSGITTVGQVYDENDPPLRYDPQHPLANDDGFVAGPVVDFSGMMIDLLIAQRSYQANVRSVQSATEAYESALRLGSQQ